VSMFMGIFRWMIAVLGPATIGRQCDFAVQREQVAERTWQLIQLAHHVQRYISTEPVIRLDRSLYFNRPVRPWDVILTGHADLMVVGE
jgi:hypothetical protein